MNKFTYNKSLCVYYKDNFNYVDFPEKCLSVPKSVYEVITKFDFWNTVLYSTKISPCEVHFKVKPLTDKELIRYVEEFNSKLINHRNITILEFLIIINHYAYDGAVEIIEDTKYE